MAMSGGLRIAVAALIGSATVVGVSACAKPSEQPLPAPSSPSAATSMAVPDIDTVTDPDSGANVRLASGPALASVIDGPDGKPMVHKYVVQLPAGVGEQRLNVTQLIMPVTDAVAATEVLARGVNGTVLSNQPVTVDGNPGADFQIRFTSGSHTGVMFGRAVYTHTYSVQVLTLVETGNEMSALPLHTQAASTLRVSAHT